MEIFLKIGIISEAHFVRIFWVWMNSDKRRCTLKVEILKFRPILFHQMPSSLLYVTKSENLFFSFFDRGTLEGNLESFVHKMSMFALNVKSKKNIKPKGNQKYINKTLRHYNNWIGGVFFREAAFFIPTTDLLVILRVVIISDETEAAHSKRLHRFGPPWL